MTTPTDLLKINVYRPLDGLRTPYTIVMDRHRNVVSDEVDEVELARIKAHPLLLKRHSLGDTPAAQQAQLLRHYGLHKHITDTGVVISREAPGEWAIAFDEWLVRDRPNPFPGTDDLRADYFVEYDDVQARIAAGTCPGCELLKIQVTFRVRLREMIDA